MRGHPLMKGSFWKPAQINTAFEASLLEMCGSEMPLWKLHLEVPLWNLRIETAR
jgi:hypothetical protein